MSQEVLDTINLFFAQIGQIIKSFFDMIAGLFSGEEATEE